MESHWDVDVTFEEDDNRTVAVCRLNGPGAPDCLGYGYSRRSPDIRLEPSVGIEVAAARALSNLAHELLERAADEVEAVAHRPPLSA